MANSKKTINVPVPVAKEQSPVTMMLPVGNGHDIPTGDWVLLPDGSSVILGGIPQYWAISGPPNSYKTSLLVYFEMCGMESVAHIALPGAMTYDSENTYSVNRLDHLLKRFPFLAKADYMFQSKWFVIYKRDMFVDEVWNVMKAWFLELGKSQIKVKTPFIDRKTKKTIDIPLPSFVSFDSMSEVESEETNKLTDKKDLGDKKAKMYYMNKGFDKSRIIGSLGTLAHKVGAFVFMSTHIGEENAMQSQGPTSFPKKRLTDMPAGKVFKGVPDNFEYLMQHIWNSSTAKVLHVDHMEKYPRTQSFKATPKGDLQEVTITLLRSKTSRSGFKKREIISQRDGLLPELSCLIDLKEEYNGFGISGNATTYCVDLLPDVKIMRTTAREIIDGNLKLRRAIEICTEMAQTFALFMYDDPNLVCTPLQLYQDITNKGYNWDIILEARGNWVPNEADHPKPRISTMDLLRARIDLYDIKVARTTNGNTKK